jgi:hypothetical protein
MDKLSDKTESHAMLDQGGTDDKVKSEAAEETGQGGKKARTSWNSTKRV